MSTPVRLTCAAALAYQAAGWTVTNGVPDTGLTTGPCTTCRQPHTRYGPTGKPHCPTCRPAAAKEPTR